MPLGQRHPKRSPQRGGISLVELAVVVSIISIVAAMAIPQYASAITNQRLEAAARRVMLDLNATKERAKAASASRSIEFTPDGLSYVMPGVADLRRSGDTYTVSLFDPPYEVSGLAVDFDGGDTLVFDGYGMPVCGDDGQVWVTVGTESATVRVDCVTGAVSVQR